jgi:AsmA protein
MKKPLKIGLIVCGALVALFVAAAVILVATVDPNEYKAEIAQAVKDQTGRQLVFEGDIGFNFFPWLGLKVGPMALGNRQGFTPDSMIRINRAEASIRILPLLSGEVAIGVVVLDGFTANLAVNKQGVNNWDDLAGAETAKPAEAKPEADAKDSGRGDGSIKDLSVQGIEITNANLVYDDAKNGKKMALSKINLIVGEVGDKTPFPFDLSFDLTMDDPKIDTRPRLTGMAAFDLTASTFDVTKLTLDALGMQLAGFAYVKAKDGLNYSGEMTLAQTNLRDVMAQIGMQAPATADPKALEKFGTTVKFNGTADSAAIEELTATLDDTTVTGTASAKNFAKPALKFSVNVDDIDVDRYLPPATKEDAAAKPAADAAPAAESAPAEEPDLTALRDLDLDGRITMGKVKAMNLRVTDILCQILAKGGVVTVKPFSANLYEGTLQGHSVLNANETPATWKEQATLENVKAGPLLKDLTGKDHVLGTTVVKYDVTGYGLTPDNIKKSLTGTASFAFTDGAVNGVNIAKMLRDAFNTIKGKPKSPDEPERTDFAELLGSAVMDKGHIVNNDLLMKSPLLRVNGKGWADLPQNSVDYLATVTVVGTLKGQDGASIEELSGLPLPIKAKGSLNDPSISLDIKALAEALLKGTFKEGTKGLEDTLRKSILGTDGQPSESSSGSTTGTTEKKKPGDFLKKLF